MKLFDYFSQCRERKNLIPAYATKSAHVPSPGIVVAITSTRLHEQVIEARVSNLVDTPGEFVCHCFFLDDEDDKMLPAFKVVPGGRKSGNPRK